MAPFQTYTYCSIISIQAAPVSRALVEAGKKDDYLRSSGVNP